MTSIGDRGGDYSAGYGAGEDGSIVGASNDVLNHQLAFLWQRGSMRDLGTLGGDSSQAYATSAAGTIVGYSYDANWNFLAFIWTNGQMRSLGTLGGDWSKAFGINNAGQFTGYGTLHGAQHAFLLDPQLGLRVTRAAGSVHLEWSGGIAPYTLQRSPDPAFGAGIETLVPHQNVMGFDDPALTDGKTRFYLVD